MIAGCCFALITAAHLDEAVFKNLGLCMMNFLHRGPFILARPSLGTRPAPSESEETEVSAERIQQAIEHNFLWMALRALKKDPPGMKLKQMAARFPEGYAVHVKYADKFTTPETDVENSQKIGELKGKLWTAMTGTSANYLFQCRKAAGLPSLKPKKSAKAKAAKA